MRRRLSHLSSREHHGTPLSTAPSPGVFLAALSQRTSKLRLGPLVYLLPAYEPLPLIEEIAMLDHLSKGRSEFGVGRGASPYEMAFFGAAADDMQPMYPEAFDIIRTALATGSLHHEGQYWRYHNIDLSIAPLQKPCPQMWVVVNSGFAVVGSAETVRDTLERQVEISGANFIGGNSLAICHLKRDRDPFGSLRNSDAGAS